MNLKAFFKERDTALLSLDRARIEAYARKWHVTLSKDDELFWASVRKAITAIDGAPEAAKREARDWLLAHGFSAGLRPVPAPPGPRSDQRGGRP